MHETRSESPKSNPVGPLTVGLSGLARIANVLFIALLSATSPASPQALLHPRRSGRPRRYHRQGAHEVHGASSSCVWRRPEDDASVLRGAMAPATSDDMLTRGEAGEFEPCPPADGEVDACTTWVVDAERVARVRREMWASTVIADTAELMKTLGSETRIRILRALSLDELCVCDLSEVLGLSSSAVSHQLRDLRRLKLVTSRSAGKLVYYRASDPTCLALLEAAIRLQGAR